MNTFGQLGEGISGGRNTPTLVMNVSDVLQIAGGSRHTCVRTTGDAVTCWGRNDRGQLGNGTVDPPMP